MVLKTENGAFNFEGLFELSPELLCIAGFDGYLKKVNSSVVKTLGYSQEELLARPINDFIHPDDLQSTKAMRAKLKRKHSLINYENRYISKSGEVVWLSWTSKASDEEEIIFAIAKNITDKKREENDRISHLADLSERNKIYKKLTYTTSHDLRAPIDNILSIIQLVDMKELSAQNEELVHVLEGATKQLKSKLSTFIDDLGKSHSVKVKVKPISFGKCIDEVLHSIRHLMETSNANISTDFSAVDKVLFNKAYLESIALNLVSNAIKYAQPSLPSQIAIYSKVVAGQTKLYFEDNGMGFDLLEVKDKIFGLHQTFHENSDSKGIGLYLVYTHITSLGGTISVESEVNKGSRFIITFSNELVESA